MYIPQVTRLDSKTNNTLVLYTFLRRLILAPCTVVTYGYFSLWNWDKDHCNQNELAILMMWKFFQKVKAN